MLMNKIIAFSMLGLVLTGCGGAAAKLAPNGPGVRLFNGIDGQASITATYRDSGQALLATSNSAAFGAASNDTSVSNTNVTSTINAASGALFTTGATLLRANSFYTLYAGGTTTANYTSQMLQDNQTILTAGTVGLRAVQMGVNVQTVDVYFVPGTTFAASGSVFTSLNFGAVSAQTNATQAVDSNGYTQVSVTSGTAYSVFVTAHGSQVVLGTAQVTPQDKGSYTIAITDSGAAAAAVAILPDVRTS